MSADARYSNLDRLVHRLAFLGPFIQLTAADVERALFGRRFRNIAVERPIFVSSLPRAGTTLLLEALATAPGVATHRYRDMPLLMAPILWDTLVGGFRKAGGEIERAHGDGMLIRYDSPEAFEEVLWRTSWPRKYRKDGIVLWTEHDDASGFRSLFTEHLQRVLALRTEGAPGSRYASKNNANVGRIGFLAKLFSDGLIVIPFRHPTDQAASLLRQHRRFLRIHRNQRFSKRYMRDIGHLEFGELHRPILFERVHEVVEDPDTMDYWIAYWLAAFEHVMRHSDRVILVSYEKLCGGGAAALQRLAERLDLPQFSSETVEALRSPRTYEDSGAGVRDQQLLSRSLALHDRLLEASIL